MSNHNGQTNLVRGFILCGDALNTNVELKTTLFRNECQEQVIHLTNDKIYNISRIWHCATMIKLLKDFTHGLLRIKLNKVM